MARLGDVCIQITDGSHNPPMGIEKSNHLMLSSKNIDDDRITFNDPRYLSQQDFEAENKRTNIEPGDLLMTIVGTIGRVAIVPDNLTGICVQRSVAVLKPKPETVYNRFLMYYLQNMCPYLEQESRGVAQKGIYLKQLNNLTVILPPLDEQRKIAAVLDKVSDLIAKRRQQLNKLDELVKSRFIEMFGDPKDNSNGWPVLPLGKLFTVSSSKRIYQSEQTSSGIPFLRISDLVQRMDERTVTAELYISEQHYAALKKEGLVPVAGDILVTSRGTLGRCYEIKEDDRFYFQDGMISWLFDKKPMVTNTYIMQLFQMPGFRKQIDDIPAGSTVNYLSLARLKELRVMCPTIELQEQFIAFVEQVDKSKLAVQQGLQELEILKKSLMQEYFE